MANLDEQDLRSAVDKVNSGKPLPGMAWKSKIPYTTLWGRVNGATTYNEA